MFIRRAWFLWSMVLAVVSFALPHNARGQTAISYPGKLTTIHTFSATDAQSPLGGLVVGDDGNLIYTALRGVAGRREFLWALSSASPPLEICKSCIPSAVERMAAFRRPRWPRARMATS